MSLKELYYTYVGGVRKNMKLVYYLHGFLMTITPKCISKWRRAWLEWCFNRYSDEERAYVQDRVDYYCKLADTCVLPLDAPTLRQHTYKNKTGNSVYFFDTYEYTRLFPDSYRWMTAPGDVTHTFDYPVVVKSRPLTDEVEQKNSVLLNMDKVRHFVFVNDPIRWSDKQDKVLFRGAIGQKEYFEFKKRRYDFMTKYFDHPLCDLGEIAEGGRYVNEEWGKPKLTIYQHLDYKFIMALEGNDVASNLKWVMSSNSIAVMPPPTCETWFMEGRLIPNVHYIAINPDYSDLEEKISYYLQHRDEAEKIIRKAHEYVNQFKNKRREHIISMLVMDKYFKKT